MVDNVAESAKPPVVLVSAVLVANELVSFHRLLSVDL